MKNQDYIANFLQREREMAANYNLLASECLNIPLRDSFLSLFERSHHVQTELRNLSLTRGWHPTGQVTQEELDQAYQKFSEQIPS